MTNAIELCSPLNDLLLNRKTTSLEMMFFIVGEYLSSLLRFIILSSRTSMNYFQISASEIAVEHAKTRFYQAHSQSSSDRGSSLD